MRVATHSRKRPRVMRGSSRGRKYLRGARSPRRCVRHVRGAAQATGQVRVLLHDKNRVFGAKAAYGLGTLRTSMIDDLLARNVCSYRVV